MLEENLDNLKNSKEAFELECISLMEKLDALMKEGVEKYDSEISKAQVAIDLHQSMLVLLDSNKEITPINKEASKELSNLETIISLADAKIKKLFTESTPRSQIIKRTVKEKVKEAPKAEVTTFPQAIPLVEKKSYNEKMKAIEETLFKKPFNYIPYPEDYYVRANGFINNKFVSEKLYEYMKEYSNEMSFKDMVNWIDEMFPNAKNRWASVDKGLANIIQLHLQKDGLLVRSSNGVYKVREEA